jgi:hypothetical protein
MSKSLPEFIEDVGTKEAARLFKVKERTAASWKRRERYPRPAKAPEIIAATRGVVDYRGIYGPADQQVAA